MKSNIILSDKRTFIFVDLLLAGTKGFYFGNFYSGFYKCFHSVCYFFVLGLVGGFLGFYLKFFGQVFFLFLINLLIFIKNFLGLLGFLAN